MLYVQRIYDRDSGYFLCSTRQINNPDEDDYIGSDYIPINHRENVSYTVYDTNTGKKQTYTHAKYLPENTFGLYILPMNSFSKNCNKIGYVVISYTSLDIEFLNCLKFEGKIDSNAMSLFPTIDHVSTDGNLIFYDINYKIKYDEKDTNCIAHLLRHYANFLMGYSSDKLYLRGTTALGFRGVVYCYRIIDSLKFREILNRYSLSYKQYSVSF